MVKIFPFVDKILQFPNRTVAISVDFEGLIAIIVEERESKVLL